MLSRGRHVAALLLLAALAAAAGARGLETPSLAAVAAAAADADVAQVTSESGGETPAPSSSLSKLTADFGSAFAASVAMILVSEIGDKTFFIAAILAMKHPRLVIFSGAMSALALMTVLSAALGYAVPSLLPYSVTWLLSILFFAGFGIKMLREWQTMDPNEGMEELQETEGELNNIAIEKGEPVPDLEAAGKEAAPPAQPQYTQAVQGLKNLLYALFTPVFIQTFTLTFLAEWGDRSQITTIAMATTQNPYGIVLGGILGHACCTGLAVIGGRLLATRISVRTVTLLGAILFLVFAVLVYAYPEPDS